MTREAIDAPPVVIKVGGSLFDLDDLAARLTRLIEELHPSPVAIVAGGGAAADVVRDWDCRFGLDASTSHWLAINAVGLNAALLAKLIPNAGIAKTWAAVAALWSEGGAAILSVDALLRAAEDAGEPAPPHSWDVTTDSIAAWAAQRLKGRLILAKSVDAPNRSVAEAIEAGLVDRWFACAIESGIPVDWINLRSDGRSIVRWITGGRDESSCRRPVASNVLFSRLACEP